MASIEGIRQQVHGAMERLPFRQTAVAVEVLDAASVTMRETMAGSNDGEATALADDFHLAASLARDVHQLLRLLQTTMQTYADRLGGTGTSVPATGQSVGVSPNPRSGGREGRRLTAEEASGLAESLPPPVPKPNPDGKKTHGVWVDEHGRRHAMVSGRDDASAEAWRQLRVAGMSPAREPAITSHVEAKLAAQMVNNDIRHVDIVLNNRPCPGVLGCDTLLPILLPEGFSMTVHGPRYRKTFTGGRKWSS